MLKITTLRQLPALGWVTLFFCSLVKLARRPPPAPGGKMILYIPQKGDGGDKEASVVFS